jgi:Methyl-accepting chemotaxis protein
MKDAKKNFTNIKTLNLAQFFGLFDDSLPDGWGLLLMDKYLKNKGIVLSEISEGSKDQRQGIEQITYAMNKMDMVTQKNAIFAHEFANTSENVNFQTVQMRELVETLASLVDGKKEKNDSHQIDLHKNLQLHWLSLLYSPKSNRVFHHEDMQIKQ